MKYASLLIVAICLCTAQCRRLTEVISITKGCMQGKILETVWNSVTYSAFLGIPYAEPPVGDLRFQVSKVTGILFSKGYNLCLRRM